MTIYFPAVSRETLRLTVTSTADPTGAEPMFAVVAAGTAPVDGDYTGNTGGWVTAYGGGGAADKTIAQTPIIGDSSATITITAGTVYDLWIRFTVGSEQPERKFDQLIAT